MELDLLPGEEYFFKPKSPSDNAQVPVTGAVLDVTRQGATVTEAVIFNEQETHTIGVVDAGLIQMGDVLALDFDATVELVVVAIAADRTSLTLQNLSKVTVAAGGQRLRPMTHRPVLYQDPAARVPFGGTAPVVDALGFARFYCREAIVDIVLTGGGLASPRMHTDRRAGYDPGPTNWVNARYHPSIQAAIDSPPAEGGTVFIPAGAYDLATTLYTPCDRPCHLVGEGSSHNGVYGTLLRWTTNTGMLRLRGDDSSVRGMTLRMIASGTAPSEHEGCGILIGRRDVADAHPHPGTSTTESEYVKVGRQPLRRLLVEDVVVLSAPGWGLSIPGYGEQSDGQPEHGRVAVGPTEGGTLSFAVTVNRTWIIASRKYGALFTGGGCTTLRFTDGACLGQGDGQTVVPTCYAYLRRSVQPVFRDWIFEGTSPAGDTDGLTRPWVQIVGCESAVLDACWFENDPHSDSQGAPRAYDPQYFIHLSGACRATTLRQLHLVRGGDGKGRLLLIYCVEGGVDGLSIDQPYAISTSVLTQPSSPGNERRAPTDTKAIVLNGLTNPEGGNKNIVVSGSGIAFDAGIQLPTSDDLRWVPITFESVPPATQLSSRLMQRVPLSTKEQRTNGNPDNDAMFSQLGAVAMEKLAGGQAVPSMLFCSGGDGNWRLANNLPSLTAAERDARGGWVQGDMILNTSAGLLQLFYEGGWRTISNLPLS